MSAGRYSVPLHSEGTAAVGFPHCRRNKSQTIKARRITWQCEKGVENPTLMRLNVSDLIWGTDAAHTSAGRRPNPSPWKSYWATGLGVGWGLGGGEWVYATVLQMGSIWIGPCKAEEPHICFMIKSAISGGNCLVLLNSSHADICWPFWFFTSLDKLLICRLAFRFFLV